MKTIDYNGEGDWSVASIQRRYAEYANLAKIIPRDLSPELHSEGSTRWVYPVMDKVTEGIEAGDPACITIGIEFIEQDQSFPFGRLLKSRAARALRRASLTRDQEERVLRRVFAMLKRGYVPWEFYEYARLARRIGFDMSRLPPVEGCPIYAEKYHRYFRLWAKPDA